MTSNDILSKVKKLRELTGVGFKDCKNALDETNGNIDESIDILRKKGIAKANKKMERVAADGLISIESNESGIAMIEINCETDFVAKNSEFINFSKALSIKALECSGNMEKVMNSKIEVKEKKVKDRLIELISKIGEKITVRRCDFVKKENSIFSSYIHTSIQENIGKLGVILSLESDIKNQNITDFAKKLCMHIAATNPLSIDSSDLSKNIIKKEEDLILSELENSGKNENIIEKIKKGKILKFIEDNTLLNQTWIMDPEKKVKDIINTLDKSIKIKKFTRYKVGEGL